LGSISSHSNIRKEIKLRGTESNFLLLSVWLSLTRLNHPFWILCKVRYTVLELWFFQERSRYDHCINRAENETRVDASVPETLPRESAKG
jgi:hypothetical protein